MPVSLAKESQRMRVVRTQYAAEVAARDFGPLIGPQTPEDAAFDAVCAPDPIAEATVGPEFSPTCWDLAGYWAMIDDAYADMVE